MKKKLLGLIIVAGAAAAAAKLAMAKKVEWQGLSEAQAREKVDQSLPSRVPDEKRAEVADKVVAKMRERGMLEETVEPVVESDEEETVAEEAPAEEAPAEEAPAEEAPAEDSPEEEKAE